MADNWDDDNVVTSDMNTGTNFGIGRGFNKLNNMYETRKGNDRKPGFDNQQSSNGDNDNPFGSSSNDDNQGSNPFGGSRNGGGDNPFGGSNGGNDQSNPFGGGSNSFDNQGDGNQRGGRGGGRGFGRGGRGGRGGGRGGRDGDGGGGGGFRGNRNGDGGGGGGGYRGNREENGGGGGFRSRNRGNDGDNQGWNNEENGKGGDRKNRDGNFNNKDKGGGDGDGPEKPREVYIPPERSDDDDVLYGNNLKAGINFSKYDSIEVKVSGEDAPGPINSFSDANLRNLLLENIKKSGYDVPTPIQKYALPVVMNNRDLMGCAQTGSGKTAAFMVPIVHKLLDKSRDYDNMSSASNVEPRALVMTPTRELAVQNYDAARKFSKGSTLKCQVVYGGTSTGHQTRQIFSGCDILVATPGRLLDMVGRGKIIFSAIEFVVLDEADKMLDMGFLEKIEQVLKHDTMVPKSERQTLMFSATFPKAIQELAVNFLNNYVFVAVGIVGSACTDVEQIFIEVTKKEKRTKLQEILEQEASNNTLGGTLIFVSEKKTADFLASILSENDLPATSIHGDRLQREREEALADFTSGRKPIMTATAVAARGLDMKIVRHVINYDLPQDIDEYIHKIGRTGRVGNKGKATSFYDPKYDSRIQADLMRILGQVGQTVPDCISCSGGGGGYEPSTFGGQDIRSFSDVQSSNAGAAQTVEDEENW